MKKKNILIVLAVLAFVLPCIVYAAGTFVVQETEKVKLDPQITDPDNDNLTVSYQFPLDKSGEWQTTYGDAGEYKTRITVSDGSAATNENITLIVRRKEEVPTIDFYLPQENSVKINEGQTADFSITASDLNRDDLAYQWFLDGKLVSEGQNFSFSPSYAQAGNYKIMAIVSDNLNKVSKGWSIEVADINIENMLDNIPDVAINENELASLELPDFIQYKLSYEISMPIGNGNEWYTGYGDAGTYRIKIHAEGNGFKGDKTVNVIVNDLDRPVVFEKIQNQFIEENQELKIELNAYDPDNTEINFSAENIPDGAVLAGNIFLWKPGFDTVKKTGLVDYVVGNFRPLTETFYIRFKASSNGNEVVRNVIVTVKDVNRAPVIKDMGPITINEGESFAIKPEVYDPDGDKISLSYSGIADRGAYKSGFDDAGIYTVQATASDGSSETSKDFTVIINNTNRKPVLKKIADKKANEGDKVVIVMDTYDPDGDSISYSIQNPPEGSEIRGNVFEWTPSFGSASNGGSKRFDFVIIARDGKDTASQPATVYIKDKNRAPRIINASRSIIGRVNEPVLMFVKAADDDVNELSYTWDFGFLNKYKATPNHQRIFKTEGHKEVKVTVSDGIAKTEQIINVFIGPSAGVLTGSSVTAAPISANKPPVIKEATTNVVAQLNKPVLLSVRAVDPDNDPLAYTWDFGLFDRQAGKSNNQRTFTSRGLKEVKVTISDGQHEVSHVMHVNVI